MYIIGLFFVALSPIIYMVLKTYKNRRYYEKQGITFTKTMPVFGSEVAVTDLIHENKTRDYIYSGVVSKDLIGCVRGFDIQLYGVNKETTEALIRPTNFGVTMDRDTPALYSFGQLSPSALTFTPIRADHFHERKVSILKGFDMGKIDEISCRLSVESCGRAIGSDRIDTKWLVSEWTRDVMGEFVWGRNSMNMPIRYKDVSGKVSDRNFMLGLNETFTHLRYYSNRFWNRVYFPIATWPVTREARRLQFNIKSLQEHLKNDLKNGYEVGTVADYVIREHQRIGINEEITRDDLLTVSIAGLDTVQSMILATIWNLYSPENKKWKDAIIESDGEERKDIIEACINESIRLDPPGSVINNKVVKDFVLETSGGRYSLKKGTRIMPNIHALHAVYGESFSPERFLHEETRKNTYVMPFGKGRRSCPGQSIGMLMAVNFVNEFIARFPASVILNADDEYIHFNNISRSVLFLSGGKISDKVKDPLPISKGRIHKNAVGCPYSASTVEMVD